MINLNEITANENVDPQEVERLIDKFNLYWAVKKEKLFLPDGIETPFFGTVRQDTRKTFAAVKEGYEVFQNWEMAELILRVAEATGGEVERGGTFDGGGKVFLQIGRQDKYVAKDIVQRWVTGINSFDGSTSLKWGGTNTTISCRNSFWAAYRGLDTTIRHTKNMRQLVENSLQVIRKIEEADKTLFEVFANFANTSADQSTIKRVVEKVTSVDIMKKQSEAEKDYSTRAMNNAKELTQSIVTEMSDKGDNLWGLFSGMTHYTSHRAGSDKTREKSKALGNLQRVDQAVFEMLKDMIYA